jgi:hypothetical protein
MLFLCKPILIWLAADKDTFDRQEKQEMTRLI